MLEDANASRRTRRC